MYPFLSFVPRLVVIIMPYSPSFSASSCTNGSSCTISSANSSQQCHSSSSSVSHETALSIQGGYDGAVIDAKVGTAETIQTTTESGVTSTWTNDCSWTGDGCHFVCSQQQMAGFSGMRDTDVTSTRSLGRAKYEKTICMQDLDVIIPHESTFLTKPLPQISRQSPTLII